MSFFSPIFILLPDYKNTLKFSQLSILSICSYLLMLTISFLEVGLKQIVDRILHFFKIR